MPKAAVREITVAAPRGECQGRATHQIAGPDRAG